MKVETFLKQFGHLADAPNGVQKLRELVLQLAVRGKLVSQQRVDEPATQLVKRILDHKSKVTGKPSQVPSIPTKELGFNIPASWSVARFGDIVVNRDGERVPVSKEIRQTRPGPFDYYGASGVIDKIDGFLFDKPLLLIGEDGANLINRSTPIAFIAQGQYWVNNHAHVLDGISHEFLNYIALFINATDLRPYVTGSAQPKMNQAKMNSIPVALPPLAEQQRIVAKVDELLALCDELEAHQARRNGVRTALATAALNRLTAAPTPVETAREWSRVAQHFDTLFAVPQTIPQLRQAIQQLAVSGRLVEQEAGDEPVTRLIDSLREHKARLADSRSKKRTHPPIETKDTPYSLPSQWVWVRLEDVVSLKHGYAFKSSGFVDYPTQFVLTTPGNFYEQGGFRDRGAKTKYYAHDVDPQFVLAPGDLIIPMTEQAPGLLGSPAFIPNDGKTYLHNQRLGKITPHSTSIAPQYLSCFFNSPYFRRELAESCSGTTVRHTSPDKILRIRVPICSLAEQRRIAARVAELDAMLGTIHAQLTTRQASAERLTAAMVRAVLDGVGAAA